MQRERDEGVGERQKVSKWVEASEEENGGVRNGNVEKQDTLMHLPAQLENTRSLAPGNDLLKLITSFQVSPRRFLLDFTYLTAAYIFFKTTLSLSVFPLFSKPAPLP